MWSRKRLIVLPVAFALLSVPASAIAATLPLSKARFFAKQYMQTRANRTDADGWTVGRCSRITGRVVRCDADIYYVGGPSCVLSVQVRLAGTSDVYVKGRNTNCD